MELNDNDLYNGLLEQDKDCWSVFYDKYEDHIYSVVRKTLGNFGNEMDVEDCVSTTFIYIWESLNVYPQGKYTFKNWVSMVAGYRAINHREKLINEEDKMRNFVDYYQKCYANDIDEVEDYLISQEDTKTLHLIFDSFKEPQSEILKRRFIESQPAGKIAKHLGLKSSKVYDSIKEGKKKLKEILVLQYNEKYI